MRKGFYFLKTGLVSANLRLWRKRPVCNISLKRLCKTCGFWNHFYRFRRISVTCSFIFWVNDSNFFFNIQFSCRLKEKLSLIIFSSWIRNFSIGSEIFIELALIMKKIVFVSKDFLFEFIFICIYYLNKLLSFFAISVLSCSCSSLLLSISLK